MINKVKDQKPKIKIILYSFFFILFSFYSYAFLDIALTLTSWEPFLEFQKRIQRWGYFNRLQSTIFFIFLSALLFAAYYLLIKSFKQNGIKLKKIVLLSILISGILIFSYPAFSHDVFNYIFNAKMALVYKADPHKTAAIQFKDPMLGFMRNIHTPAPYFYGWTIISFLPYILGAGRIFPELVSFKFFSALNFFLVFLALKKIYSIFKLSNDKLRLTLFLLNPLILIEAIGVGHNDLTMMAPVLFSFYFLLKYKEKKQIKFILSALFCFLLSVSIKYTTLILGPLFLLWYFYPAFDLGFWGAGLLFLLPFSRPLDQLHSWYLLWPLCWSFLSRKIRAVYSFVFLSFFALARYAPYIYYGNWDPPVARQRLLIYFLVPLTVFIYSVLMKAKFFFKKTGKAET